MGKRTNTAKWMENQRRWQINVQKDGVRRSFTSSKPGRTGQREANAKADAWLDDGITDSSYRISRIYVDYLDDLKARSGESNWRPEDSRWRNWILPEIGQLKLSNLTEQHLQNVINKAATAGKSKKHLKNIRADLYAFCKYCRKRKASNLNPENVVVPDAAPVGIRKILQPEDLLKLFTIDTTMLCGKRQKDAFIYAYRFHVTTGLRPGELLGLKWSDIKNDVVHVQRSINVLGEETRGKNKNADRSFYLNDLTKSILEKQMEDTAEGEYVFPRITENGYWRRLKKYCASNELPMVSAYEMRHTFISIIQQLPESDIKAIVGHSRSMDTFGVYAHSVDGRKASIAAGIEKVFDEIISK